MRTTRKLLLGLALLGTACSTETPAPMDPIGNDFAASVAGGWGPETPNFNLEAILRGTGFGLVRFRQPNDAEFRIYLDLWVRDLKPNTEYVLERAVDNDAPDDVCSSTAWLSLGSVITDATGTGRAALNRLIPASLSGVEFDIHFHVIEQATGAEALVTDCYQYTVSM
jgi:hypothetical protein